MPVPCETSPSFGLIWTEQTIFHQTHHHFAEFYIHRRLMRKIVHNWDHKACTIKAFADIPPDAELEARAAKFAAAV